MKSSKEENVWCNMDKKLKLCFALPLQAAHVFMRIEKQNKKVVGMSQAGDSSVAASNGKIPQHKHRNKSLDFCVVVDGINFIHCLQFFSPCCSSWITNECLNFVFTIAKWLFILSLVTIAAIFRWKYYAHMQSVSEKFRYVVIPSDNLLANIDSTSSNLSLMLAKEFKIHGPRQKQLEHSDFLYFL